MDYRNRIYQSYLSSSAHHYQSMRDPAIYEELRPFYRKNHLQWLPVDRSVRVLDVGCGAGQCLYFLQKEGYEHAEGIDVSLEMLDQCRTLGLTNTHQSDWREFLAERPEAYGTIVANDFLEHLTGEEVLEFLDLAFGALQIHGRLLLKLPNAYTIFGTRDRYVDFTHQMSFTPQSGLQVLTVVGFAPIRILPVHAPIRGIKSALRRIIWEIGLVPAMRFCSYLFDGERKPAIYTINFLAVADKP